MEKETIVERDVGGGWVVCARVPHLFMFADSF